MRHFYTFFWYLMLPVIFLRLWLRGRKNPDYRLRWGERLALGYTKKSHHIQQMPQKVIWVHSVSVGETLAAVPLIRALQKQYPAQQILVTTTTPTGSERVLSACGNSVLHCYLPYDLPGAIKRFLNYYQPEIFIILETELWPNLIRQCYLKKIPVVLVNARLSKKSAAGYERFSSISGPMFHQISKICTQTEKDSKHFSRLLMRQNNNSVRPTNISEKIMTTGNIKFDLEIPEKIVEQGKALRNKVFPQSAPVWIAASTHKGEDEKVLSIHAQVLEKCPNAKLIIVPRHQERFQDVITLCQATPFTISKRSQPEGYHQNADIFIGDSMGELLLFYAMSDCAFVGGSLVRRGGHNLLEAEAFGCPVVVGPYTFNFDEATNLMIAAGAALQTDEGEMPLALLKWLSNENARKLAGEAGKKIVLQNKGALEKLMQVLKSVIIKNNEKHYRKKDKIL